MTSRSVVSIKSRIPVNMRYMSPHRRKEKDSSDTTNSAILSAGIISGLESRNCEVQGKIIIEVDNVPVIRYVKCCVPNGCVIFVDVESDEFKVSDEDASYVMKKIDSNLISHSKKHGDYKMCYPEADGVVFEHIDYIVVVMPDSNLNPIEKTYCLKSDNVEVDRSLSRPLSYPLIKSSNLFVNPPKIFGSVSLASTRVSSQETKTCYDDISDMMKCSHKLASLVESIAFKYREICKGYNEDNLKLDESLNRNIKLASDLRMIPNSDEKRAKCVNKIDRIHYNLAYRKGSFKNIYGQFAMLESFKNKIEPIIESLNCLNDELTAYHEYINFEKERGE